MRNKPEELIQLIKTETIKTNPNQNKINKTQQYLQDIENYKITGSIIRSKEKIILEQEKPNKFFFDQEKQKQKQKAIKQLQHTQNNQTTIITNDSEILKHCKEFYSTLYTKTQTNIDIEDKLLKPITTKINAKNEKLIRKISLPELKSAIFQMKNGKSPGIDGIPIEVYKSQYEVLKHDVLQL